PPIEHRISLPEDIRLSEQSRNKLVALAQLLNGSKIHITKSENGRFGYTVLSENGSVLIRLDENYQPCLGAVSKLFEQQLEEERAARTAAEQRAEQAETEAAKLRQVLAGNQPQESAGQPDCEPAQPATGLTFPYTTKSLEAARAAVQKYWYDFDPMRLPLQKQVKAFMVDLGVPGRQAAELAIAIKPDDPPKA
ncbi:MAG: hypothetical protein ACRERX_18850, partial [Pseudomonas sp.]